MQKNDYFFLSILVIILPIFFGLFSWNKLPDLMPIHFNYVGEVNTYVNKYVAVFLLPIFMLIIHLIAVTSYNKVAARELPSKINVLIIWIVPLVTVGAFIITYSYSLGFTNNSNFFGSLLVGIIFACIGNYLPKTKQNNILGIRLPWTLKSESCWNKTHRFSGKVWVLGGIVIIISAFLQMYILVLITTFAMIIISIVYSYLKRNE